MSVGLSQVLEEMGNENVELQILDSSITGFKQNKKDTKIKFATDKSNTPNLCLADGCFYTKKLCLILWVDRKEYDNAINTISQRNKEKETK